MAVGLLSINEQEMLDVLHKFDERHQVKLISQVEMLAGEMLLDRALVKQGVTKVNGRVKNVVYVNFSGEGGFNG